MRILKKVLLFIGILIVASVLFTGGSSDHQKNDSISEIVELIEDSSTSLIDGYVENPGIVNQNPNFFVTIVKVVSNLIKSLFSGIFNVITFIISAFTG